MPDAAGEPGGAAPAAAPERPVYLLASWGARLKAWIVDTLLVIVPTAGLWAAVLPGLFDAAARDRRLEAELDAIDPDTGEGPLGRLLLWAAIISGAALALYWVVLGLYSGGFMSRTAGQTPGRRLAGIRVMRTDGRPVGFWWAVWRVACVRGALFALGSLLSAGSLTVAQYLWPLWDDQRRALHDMVARSRVVQDARPQP